MSTIRSVPRLTTIATATVAATLLAACGSMYQQASTFSQDSLPAPVQVPAGHKVA